MLRTQKYSSLCVALSMCCTHTANSQHIRRVFFSSLIWSVTCIASPMCMTITITITETEVCSIFFIDYWKQTLNLLSQHILSFSFSWCSLDRVYNVHLELLSSVVLTDSCTYERICWDVENIGMAPISVEKISVWLRFNSIRLSLNWCFKNTDANTNNSIAIRSLQTKKRGHKQKKRHNYSENIFLAK